MPINAGYEYSNAEKLYYQAQTLDERIAATKELIKTAPKHKGSENLLAGLRTRLKKFEEKKEKSKSSGKTTKKSIRKDGFQCVILGFTNTGKSSILSVLTNARPKIEPYEFTTKVPEIGTLDYNGVKAQVVDLPSIGSEGFDIGIVNTADCIIIVIKDIEEIEKINQVLSKSSGRKIIVISKVDLLSFEEKRKLQEKLKSKRIEALLFSSSQLIGLEELKEKIFLSMRSIRIFTKEPGKAPSTQPMVLKEGSSVKDCAESILKGFSLRVKETKVTGPSSKFPNQKVGLSHILKDKDIVEFKTN